MLNVVWFFSKMQYSIFSVIESLREKKIVAIAREECPDPSFSQNGIGKSNFR